MLTLHNFNSIPWKWLMTDKLGGVQPHFCPWKNVCFPIFSHGEKSIWKEREMNTFPFPSIYFFPIFPWAKMGLDPPTFFPIFPRGKKWENTFFHGQKWSWTPPPHKLKAWQWLLRFTASYSSSNCGRMGGVQPHFCPWENCVFSHFSPWEKSIWKEREMNTFPSFSIYFFSIFPWAKMGLDPPQECHILGTT